MPTRAPSTTTSVSALATTLKAQLASSQSAIVYVPLEDGDPPSADELAALLAAGIHAEYDAVRNALAARAATDDEVSAAAPKDADSIPSASSSTPDSSA